MMPKPIEVPGKLINYIYWLTWANIWTYGKIYAQKEVLNSSELKRQLRQYA